MSRPTRRILHKGQIVALKDLAKAHGIPYQSLYCRWKGGQSGDYLVRPVNENMRRKSKPAHVAGHKTCKKCKTVKSLDDFHVNGNARDGRASRCAECINTAKTATRVPDFPVAEFNRAFHGRAGRQVALSPAARLAVSSRSGQMQPHTPIVSTTCPNANEVRA